ncbi:MAG: hypothetical protein H6581_14575 [Bacteroidia bacterium]|nr:hypothetical protein [Bacteroidia bacterium]
MNSHANKTPESSTFGGVKKTIESASLVEQGNPIQDNRPEVAAQQNFQQIINDSPQVQQAVQMKAMADSYVQSRWRPEPAAGEKGNETIPVGMVQEAPLQLKSMETDSSDSGVIQLRGKTKYGAMMGNTRQGPHTIAHGTLVAIERILNYGSIEKYEKWLAEGIILDNSDIWNWILKEYGTISDGYDPNDVLWNRYLAYYKAYKKSFDYATYYYQQLTSGKKLKKVTKADYEVELGAYLNDLRDMHPDSTYGSDILLEGEEVDVSKDKVKTDELHQKRLLAEKDWLFGKGEPSIDSLEVGFASIVGDNSLTDTQMRADLLAKIMANADVSELESDDSVKDLAGKWVNLLMEQRTPYVEPEPVESHEMEVDSVEHEDTEMEDHSIPVDPDTGWDFVD